MYYLAAAYLFRARKELSEITREIMIEHKGPFSRLLFNKPDLISVLPSMIVGTWYLYACNLQLKVQRAD